METVKFQGQDVYLIKAGQSKVWIAPQHGGRLLRWIIDDTEIIHWPEDADWKRVKKVRGGNPILFPFIARHMVDGEIGFWKDGDTIREMPMHGFARDLPFSVVEQNESELLMRLEHNETTLNYFPFKFQLDVKISLQAENKLRFSLKTKNLSDRPMPYYPGTHFYFTLPRHERPDWNLQIPCTQTARQKPDGNITFNSRAGIETTFADPDLVDRMHIMESKLPVRFGHKAPEKPQISIRLDHPETVYWGAVTTWTESEESDFYCVEPWTGLPNAIHHRHGLRLLSPGATEKAICKIEVET